MELPSLIQNLVEQFSKLPGVGEKTALRQSLFLSGWTANELYEFGNSVKAMASLDKCDICMMFAEKGNCFLCNSPTRKNSKSICVVESFLDYLAIEKSGHYQGKYHVLGGVLNPLLGVGPDQLSIEKLLKRTIRDDIEEIILAINPSVEGDATCSYLKQILPSKVFVDRIGFGIPIGGSLEYLDSMTISKALENKKRM